MKIPGRNILCNACPIIVSGWHHMQVDDKSPYHLLPSVDELLRMQDIAELAAREGHAVTTEAVRSVIEQTRKNIASGKVDPKQLLPSTLSRKVNEELERSLAFSLRPVINATGVVLHTNLGRAPLSANALAHM